MTTTVCWEELSSADKRTYRKAGVFSLSKMFMEVIIALRSSTGAKLSFFFFKILFICSWETQREAETQAEGEAGSLQGAPCGTRPQGPGSGPETKADTQLLSHPGVPGHGILKAFPRHRIFWNFCTTQTWFFWHSLNHQINAVSALRNHLDNLS